MNNSYTESGQVFHLSRRLAGLDLSEIVRLSERAHRLRSQGKDVIALSTGEPDFPTPAFVVEAAHLAALDGQTRYPPTAGTAALRAAIALRGGAAPAQVIVSTGAKQVIANALMATLDPGDEVIIPAPFWTSYADMVRLAGGVPVIVRCQPETGFKLNAQALAAALTPNTRWLMLNSPSNPSGAVYSDREIRALAEVLEEHPQVLVLADEIYGALAFVPFVSFRQAAPRLAERTLIVDGVSKAWSMTGWRIGWGIGPEALIGAMIKVQGQFTSGASSIGQAAALAALGGDPALLADRRAVFRARRDKVVEALNAMPGLSCAPPDGAFYAFASCGQLLRAQGGPFETDAAFCDWALSEAGVAIVPGRAFGLSGYFRLSFACSDADLDTALDRLSKALTGLVR